jgi:hypothetical protein
VVATYAALVVVMGLAADLRLAAEIDSPKDPDNIVFWGNLFTLALSTTYVSLAVVFRERPEVHERSTLLASVAIAIVAPALAERGCFATRTSPHISSGRPPYQCARNEMATMWSEMDPVHSGGKGGTRTLDPRHYESE